MSYSNINKLCNHLDQRGTDGAPTESGWYVLEVERGVYGIGFYDNALRQAKVTVLNLACIFHCNADGEDWTETRESASFSPGLVPGILRFAPLRFDLKD